MEADGDDNDFDVGDDQISYFNDDDGDEDWKTIKYLITNIIHYSDNIFTMPYIFN